MIVVIRTDISGGFAIITRKDYQSEMLKILNSTIGKDGSEEKCYVKVDQDIIIRHYLSIKEIVNEGLNRELYNKRVADNLIQKQPQAGRLYGTLKDHKPIQLNSNLPPLRPVVSGSGSNTEMISRFIDFYLKPLVKDIPSYIRDTKDFLTKLQSFESIKIPQNVIPVSIDVVSLYSSIPLDDAVKAVEEALNRRNNDQKEAMPTDFII